MYKKIVFQIKVILLVLFDIYWTEFLRDLIPWGETIFKIITELGSTTIYLAVILAIFWGINKRAAIVTAFVVVGSSILNYWFKAILKHPRPDTSHWLPGVGASNYSLPSGHAQSAATFYGWISRKIKTWWMVIIGFSLIFLIGISRIYLGVHWLGDVLLGWLVGLLIVIFVWRYENSIESYLSRYNPYLIYLGLAIFGFIAIFLTEFLLPVPTDNFGGSGGILMGLAIGLALERRFVNFQTNTDEIINWMVVLRILIGLVLVLLLYYGLSPVLSSENAITAAIRYGIVALVGAFGWPLIFTKLNL